MSPSSYSEPAFVQRIASMVYRLHTRFEGPMHMSCGIGETRREVVRWFARRVRDLTSERRMAFLAGFCDEPYPNESTGEA